MVSITLSIPQETRKNMKAFPEINWSGLVRKTIEDKIRELREHQSIKLRLEQEKPFRDWAVQLQRKTRKGRFQELKDKGLV